MRLPVKHALPLAALIFLSFSSTVSLARDKAAAANARSGPAADYPVVVGDPFTIGGTTWTPADQLNYDAVGYAVVNEGGEPGVTAAHKTLPLPSYAEVTALDSGRTILVRITRRGPMTNENLAELSPDAAAQLGIAPGAHAAIRVRRVNPPEAERALLRSGDRAAERIATPEGLLKVLRRKLAGQSPLLPPPSTPPTMPKGPPSGDPAVERDKPVAPPATAPTVVPAPMAAPKAASPAPQKMKPPQSAPPVTEQPAKDVRVVQIGMFSVEANARRAAIPLGAQVTPAGKFWRVRLGPFANRAQAAAALEKARAAGYSDARIQRAD